MTKELESLELLSNYANDCHHFGEYEIEYRIVLKALHRLETIDNTESSEALEEIGNIDLGDNPYKTFERNKLKNVYNNEFNTIKQALIKSQEQEKENAEYKKILEIIKKKKVSIDLLYASSSVKQYNDELIRVYGYTFSKGRLLTDEEFELLKKWHFK